MRIQLAPRKLKYVTDCTFTYPTLTLTCSVIQHQLDNLTVYQSGELSVTETALGVSSCLKGFISTESRGARSSYLKTTAEARKSTKCHPLVAQGVQMLTVSVKS